MTLSKNQSLRSQVKFNLNKSIEKHALVTWGCSLNGDQTKLTGLSTDTMTGFVFVLTTRTDTNVFDAVNVDGESER